MIYALILLYFSPLTDEQLNNARKRRHMEIRLKILLQDLMSYMVFLTFLVLVVRGYRDPDEYYFRKALEDDIVHQHFKSVRKDPYVCFTLLIWCCLCSPRSFRLLTTVWKHKFLSTFSGHTLPTL